MAYPVRVSQGLLFDSVTGAWVGVQGADGKEYLCAGVQNVGASVAPVAFNSANVTITGGSATFNGNLTTFGTLRSTGTFSAPLTDGSGTPGNVTQNVMHGRAAVAAAGASVVVTNSQVAANSSVFVQLGGLDATLLMVRVTTSAGSFTVTGNAAATGITPFDYFVVQN